MTAYYKYFDDHGEFLRWRYDSARNKFIRGKGRNSIEVANSFNALYEELRQSRKSGPATCLKMVCGDEGNLDKFVDYLKYNQKADLNPKTNFVSNPMYDLLLGPKSHAVRLVDPATGDIRYYSHRYKSLMPISDDGLKNADPDTLSVILAEKRSLVAQFVFNPWSQDERLSPPNELGFCQFNMFEAPKWRKEDKEITECPKHIDWIINHLLGNDPESVHYFHCWLHHALFLGKNVCTLALVTIKGLGKNVFLTHVLKPLFGAKYVLTTGSDAINTNFNNELRHKSIVAFDEVQITKDNAHRFRFIVGEETRYEQKGRDAITEGNPTNFLLFSNEKAHIHLEEGDRRFSVPMTGNTKLEDACRDQLGIEPAQLIKLLEEEARDYGHFLRGYDLKDWTTEKPLKTQMFWDIVEYSKKEWVIFLKNYVKQLSTRGVFIPMATVKRDMEAKGIKLTGREVMSRLEFKEFIRGHDDLVFEERDGEYGFIKR